MPKSFADCLDCKCSPKRTQKYIDQLSKIKAPTPELQEEIMSQIMTLADCMDMSLKHKSGWGVKGYIASFIVAVIVAGLVAPGLGYGLRRAYLTYWPGLVDSVIGKANERGRHTVDGASDEAWWVMSIVGALLVSVLTFMLARLFLFSG